MTRYVERGNLVFRDGRLWVEVLDINRERAADDARRIAHLIEVDTEGAPSHLSVQMIKELVRTAHRDAKAKGWWDTDRMNGELIALIHSELSEALEALRQGDPPDDKIPGYSGAEIEMADVVIRVMDMCGARGWRLGEAIWAKMEYNRRRSHKHGGKVF